MHALVERIHPSLGGDDGPRVCADRLVRLGFALSEASLPINGPTLGRPRVHRAFARTRALVYRGRAHREVVYPGALSLFRQ